MTGQPTVRCGLAFISLVIGRIIDVIRIRRPFRARHVQYASSWRPRFSGHIGGLGDWSATSLAITSAASTVTSTASAVGTIGQPPLLKLLIGASTSSAVLAAAPSRLRLQGFHHARRSGRLDRSSAAARDREQLSAGCGRRATGFSAGCGATMSLSSNALIRPSIRSNAAPSGAGCRGYLPQAASMALTWESIKIANPSVGADFRSRHGSPDNPGRQSRGAGARSSLRGKNAKRATGWGSRPRTHEIAHPRRAPGLSGNRMRLRGNRRRRTDLRSDDSQVSAIEAPAER